MYFYENFLCCLWSTLARIPIQCPLLELSNIHIIDGMFNLLKKTKQKMNQLMRYRFMSFVDFFQLKISNLIGRIEMGLNDIGFMNRMW